MIHSFQIQLKTLEVLKRIFCHSTQPTVVPFVHSLAPSIVQIVNAEIEASTRSNITKSKYNLVMVGLEIMETLVRAAQKSLFFSHFPGAFFSFIFSPRLQPPGAVHPFADEFVIARPESGQDATFFRFVAQLCPSKVDHNRPRLPTRLQTDCGPSAGL